MGGRFGTWVSPWYPRKHVSRGDSGAEISSYLPQEPSIVKDHLEYGMFNVRDSRDQIYSNVDQVRRLIRCP